MKSIPLILLCSLLFIIPRRDIIEDESDYIEINHVYTYDETKMVHDKRMTQIIWWNWNDSVLIEEKDIIGKGTGVWHRGGAFVVMDYKVIWSSGSSPNQTRNIIPVKDGREYVCLFYDKDDKVMRKVSSGWLRITHTEVDQEIENRRILRFDDRKRLTPPPNFKK